MSESEEIKEPYRSPLTGRIRKGNPNLKKGGPSLNPAGRPVGGVNYSVRHKLNKKGRHPIDELVKLADELKMAGKFAQAAEIWLKIQEYVEPKKKPVETAPERPLTPEQSKENVEDMLKLLEEVQDGTEGGSGTDRMETGEAGIQAEASPEEDTQEPTGK